MRRASIFFVFITLFCWGCGDDAAVDGGGDTAEADVTVEDVPGDVGSDSGQICDTECQAGEACCLAGDETMCIDVTSDPLNCGRCGRDCIAEGRGDRCQFGVCVCGNIVQGCAGDNGNLCCPARTPADTNYCANLERDPTDCGACGDACDPLAADRCDGGQCRCGDSREACGGTPESTCCRADVGDTECIDTTTNRLHCGGCNNACLVSESCVEGSCTVGEVTCEDPCIPGQVCCGGSCCLRNFCLDDGMCSEDE
ncbi:MAG: hypothetical protein AB8H86_28320 [Polyangiales bacterium]